ncbi:MAG: hypothetical protein LUD43_01910 [Firmicutes bacterium]|nr:hypothetical protein [Bacillota bacterium]
MKLLKITLQNFQGIKSLSFDFPDGRSASIYGDNATGKTTVYNALTWLLFDKASTAAKNFNPKTKGAGGDLHHLDHSSEGVFIAYTGRQITLKKTYHEVYKKKRGSATEEFSGHTVEYAVDGVPVKEKEYNDTVIGLCGGDTEKPKMLTMPDYFPEQLSWDTRRKILLEICGDISDDEIIRSTSDLRELKDFLRMNGTAEQYYTTDEYRKVAAARRSEINKQLTEIPARIDEATQAIPDTTGLDEAEIERNIEALTKKKNDLLTERAEAASGDRATATLRTEIANTKTEIAEAKAQHLKDQNDRNSGVDADILLAKREAAEERRKAEDADIDIKRKTAERTRLDALRTKLLDDYKTLSSARWNEAQAVCPTCGQPLPEDKVEAMIAEFNVRKSKELEEINQRGKTEASKTAIKELDDEIAKLQQKKEVAESLQKAAELRAANLTDKRVIPAPFETTETYTKLADKIAELEASITDRSRYTAEALSTIDGSIKAIDDTIRDERDKQMQLTMAENQKRRIGELERQEKKLSAEFEELEKGLYLCDLFTKAKVSALTDRINGKFKSVRFRLFQEQINGGLKEDCEVMIPRADGSLVPYTFANNAARINAGLEIINTLAEHWGVQMPVFIDNAESVTHLTESDTQIIRLVVSENDPKLRLEVHAE